MDNNADLYPAADYLVCYTRHWSPCKNKLTDSGVDAHCLGPELHQASSASNTGLCPVIVWNAILFSISKTRKQPHEPLTCQTRRTVVPKYTAAGSGKKHSQIQTAKPLAPLSMQHPDIHHHLTLRFAQTSSSSFMQHLKTH